MEGVQHERQPQVVDLFSREMEAALRNGILYRRKVEPLRNARQATSPETIKTRLADGTNEVTEEAAAGDWVLTGAEGEEYVLTDGRFKSLYTAAPDGTYVPLERHIRVIPNPFHGPIKVLAPWGTHDHPIYESGSTRAFIVVTLTPEGALTEDRYLIGDAALLASHYEPVN